jgi:F-type H+-transporting ATPase subunit delta
MAAVASRYAKALADIVLDPKSQLTGEQAVEHIRAFEQMLASSEELRNVLLSPAVPPARKRAVVQELTSRLQVSPLLRNFLYVVIDHRRIPILSEIRKAFERYLDENAGIVRAGITSALELNEQQREAVTQKLSQMVGKRVKSEFSVDPDLLGGVVARIGSTIYDGSVRGQLQSLRRKLLAEA